MSLSSLQQAKTSSESPIKAIAWDLKDTDVTTVLIGASKPEQILDNIKAIENTSFSAEELQAIDAISFAPGVQGLIR